MLILFIGNSQVYLKERYSHVCIFTSSFQQTNSSQPDAIYIFNFAFPSGLNHKRISEGGIIVYFFKFFYMFNCFRARNFSHICVFYLPYIRFVYLARRNPRPIWSPVIYPLKMNPVGLGSNL